MVVKEKSWKEQKTEQTRGRRRYLERRVQEQEAEKEIKDYTDPRDVLVPVEENNKRDRY